MKITVKQLKEMIKQEFENVLLEGKHEEETCPECKKAKGKCICPKNEEKMEEKKSEACKECEKLKGDEKEKCLSKCLDAEADAVGKELDKALAEPAKGPGIFPSKKEESIEEQIVAKVLEALQ